MEPEKQKLINAQSLLWIGYFVCALFTHLSQKSEWSLALLVISATVLPIAYLNYSFVPKRVPALRRATKVVWISVTTVLLFLFGVCSHIEGVTEPWPAKIGAGFYAIAVVYPHLHVFSGKEMEEMKNKTIFLVYMNLSSFLYITAAFFLALSPAFVGWKLILPVTGLFALLVAYPFFKRSNRSPPFTLFFVSLITATIFLYGLTVGDMIKEDNYDDDHTALAIGGATVALLSVIVSHLWKEQPDFNLGAEGGGGSGSNAMVGKLLF